MNKIRFVMQHHIQAVLIRDYPSGHLMIIYLVKIVEFCMSIPETEKKILFLNFGWDKFMLSDIFPLVIDKFLLFAERKKTFFGSLSDTLKVI